MPSCLTSRAFSYLEELNKELRAIPEEKFAGKKIVTTGILANSPGMLEILDEYSLV